MTSTVCSRCGNQPAGLGSAPMPGPVGETIREAVCPSCWAEWQRMEVIVINELRLNFMDPGAQKELDRHMQEFLGLLPPSGGPSFEAPPEDGPIVPQPDGVPDGGPPTDEAD